MSRCAPGKSQLGLPLWPSLLQQHAHSQSLGPGCSRARQLNSVYSTWPSYRSRLTIVAVTRTNAHAAAAVAPDLRRIIANLPQRDKTKHVAKTVRHDKSTNRPSTKSAQWYDRAHERYESGALGALARQRCRLRLDVACRTASARAPQRNGPDGSVIPSVQPRGPPQRPGSCASPAAPPGADRRRAVGGLMTSTPPSHLREIAASPSLRRCQRQTGGWPIRVAYVTVTAAPAWSEPQPQSEPQPPSQSEKVRVDGSPRGRQSESAAVRVGSTPSPRQAESAEVRVSDSPSRRQSD